MAIKDQGPLVLGLMWSMTAALIIITGLRCYTRALVVKSFGVDDCVYVFSFLLFLCYAIFCHVSATYGFGQNIWDIANERDIMYAVLYEAIGQTFAILGTSIAKWSLGLFLLRLVNKTWHKIAIWGTLAVLLIASLLSIFVFWFQCSPPAAFWDSTIENTKCGLLPQIPVYYFLRAICVFADFFFAFFPWIFIWKLQMNGREKFVILSSMSLGIIAGAFGIKVTLEIPKLISDNPLKVSVGIILWTAAEIAVTMICIGIPVCLPLYKKYIGGSSARNTSKYTGLPGVGRSEYNLRTIGGGKLWPNKNQGPQNMDYPGFRSPEEGVGSHSSASKAHFPDDNRSDEEILPGSPRSPHVQGRQEIKITEEVEVTRTKRRAEDY